MLFDRTYGKVYTIFQPFLSCRRSRKSCPIVRHKWRTEQPYPQRGVERMMEKELEKHAL